jgi:hypothetical protein
MILRTRYFVKAWLESHPKTKQWLWFVFLWFSGLLTVYALTYPLKLLINIVK